MAVYRPDNRNLFSDLYLDSHWAADFATLEGESKSAFAVLLELRRRCQPERFGSGREQQLREEYIDKVLDGLGWIRSAEGRIPGNGKPDYALFGDAADKGSALSHLGSLEFFQDVPCLCEAKSWGTDLFRSSDGGKSPRGQIYGYLEDTHVPWGIVTNGRMWLLVCREYSRAQQRDYAVDLDRLFESGEWSEDFGYFFAFFSRSAFESGFLQRAIEASHLSGEAVGKDLKTNVYEALLTLGQAIYNRSPSAFQGPAELKRLKSECLTFLYRLLFVNYAESRNLLPMRESDLYRRSYSLLRVKESIQKVVRRMDLAGYSTVPEGSSDYYRNIKKLFKAIDKGLPAAQIPPYNGGLFRSADHPFLDDLELDDRTVARVVDLLGRTKTDSDRFVDYSYLGVRELGSIYEGLIEYQFRIADTILLSEKGRQGTEVWVSPTDEPTQPGSSGAAVVRPGELYLSTASGERKAAGAYYTPDEVVRYIVRSCLTPAVDRAIATARARGDDPRLAILNLKVVDPAMGSGHFLVAATEFLAERLLDVGEEQTELSGDDDNEELESWAKRQVASHCIYGVDLNPMAVELAKVSLWLTTFSRGRPLTFLDHRLKCGNSLIGSRLHDLPALPPTRRVGREIRQTSRGGVRPFDISGLIEEFQKPFEKIDAIDEATVEDVERKKALYLAFVRGSEYARIVSLARAHTYLQYSPGDAIGTSPGQWSREVSTAVSIEHDDRSDGASDVLASKGLAFATEKLPFFWDLEFPEVFARSNPGFDVVLGNPPYVRIYRGQLSEEDVAYFQLRFRAAHMKFDLYVLFLELGIGLLRRGGRLGFIVPDKFTTSPYGEPVRALILRNWLVSILDLRNVRVFPGVAVAPVIPIIESGSPAGRETALLGGVTRLSEVGDFQTKATVEQRVFESFPQSQIRLDATFGQLGLLTKLASNSFPLRRAYYVNWGLRTGTEERTNRMISAAPQGLVAKPLLRGEDLRERYILERPPRYIEYDTSQLYNPMFPEFFANPKVIFRKISGPEGLRAVLDISGAYCFSTLICATNLNLLKGVRRPGLDRPARESRRFRDPAFVLAVANSRLVAWWYAQTFSDKLGVNPGQVQSIPMPKSLLEVSPAKASGDVLSRATESLNALSPELLEQVASVGAQRMQSLGDLLVKEAYDFRSWLAREVGEQVIDLLPNKLVERLSGMDGARLIHLLEKLNLSKPLRLDPHRRESQELILAEFDACRARMAAARLRISEIDPVVEGCIHRLFGLTEEESAQVG